MAVPIRLAVATFTCETCFSLSLMRPSSAVDERSLIPLVREKTKNTAPKRHRFARRAIPLQTFAQGGITVHVLLGWCCVAGAGVREDLRCHNIPHCRISGTRRRERSSPQRKPCG